MRKGRLTVKDLDYSYATIDSDRIYEGVDLETKFAAEIAGYSDVWAWIKGTYYSSRLQWIACWGLCTVYHER